MAGKLRTVERQWSLLALPFAFVAAINDSEVREEVMRGGGDGHLLKAFTEQGDGLAVLLPMDHFLGSEYGSS